MSIGDNVAGRLAGLSDATRRAYLSDLADLAQWCAAHGLDWEGGQVGSRHIFAYLLGLARDGRTQSTIRRRLTALRRVVASAPPPTDLGLIRASSRSSSAASSMRAASRRAFSSSPMTR